MSIVTGRRLNYVMQKIKDTYAAKTALNSYLTILSASDTYETKVNANDTYAKKTVLKEVGNLDDGLSVILGNVDSNTIDENARYAVIAGGHDNKITLRYVDGSGAAIITGYENEVTKNGAVIIGGANNIGDEELSIIISGFGCTAAGFNSVVTGHYNDKTKGGSGSGGLNPWGTSDGTAFEIGNGVPGSLSNAIRADYNGKMWCKSAYSSTGADYAELFEWQDGNVDNEIRYGYFVTMVGNNIKKANPGDWILGIVSANPCILGNTDMEWQGQFMRDEFGAFIIEDTIVTEKRKQPKLDEDGNQVYEQIPVVDNAGNQLFDKDGKPAFTLQSVFEDIEVKVPCQFYKVNPDYDPDQEYIDRLSRPEWDAIGMMGVLSVYDDGTCQADGFCTVKDGGIATASTYGYRVIERVTDNIVKVVINAESSNMVLELMNKITLLEQQIQQLSV